MKEQKRIGTIWNVTRACCWVCRFCCVDAIYIGKEQLHSGQQDELIFHEKLSIIDKLSMYNVRIDFSGGESLSNSENLELSKCDSDKIGKQNIGISISGTFLDDETIKKISGLVHDVEITLDCKPFHFYNSRPTGYHEFAGNALAKFSKYNVITGAQTIITKENMDHKSIELTPSHSDYYRVVDDVKELTKDFKLIVHFQ